MKQIIKPLCILLLLACLSTSVPLAAYAQQPDERRMIVVADAEADASGADFIRITPQDAAELSKILSSAPMGCDYIVDMPWALRDEIYTAAKALAMQNRCIFVCRADAGDAVDWKNTVDPAMRFMLYKKTNVIFSAWACIRALRNEPNGYLWLATSNPYGMIFRESVTEKFSGIQGVMLQMNDPALCGKRADTESYWEDVTSRGYNMICTDNPAELLEYRSASEAARAELNAALQELNRTWQLPDFNGAAFTKYKYKYQTALNKAVRLAETDFSGKAACKNAAYDLQTAVDAIKRDYDQLAAGKAGLTVTPGRLITAGIALVAFLALEIFMHKHRGKKSKQPV